MPAENKIRVRSPVFPRPTREGPGSPGPKARKWSIRICDT